MSSSSTAVAVAAPAAADARARLVDYFVEVVADVLPPPSRRAGECVDDFERRVTFRLPPTDHADFPLPDGVPFFCVPSCLSAASPSAFERKPTFFSFSLTGGDGSRAYGFALHFYDALPADQWRPRVFCLISHHPFFSLFKEVVSWVFRQRTHSSEQRVVESILADASGQRSWFVSPTRRSEGAATTKPYRPPPVDTGALARAVSDTTARRGAESHKPAINGGFHEDDLVDRVLSQFVLAAECPNPGGLLELTIGGKRFFSYHVHRGNVVHVDDYCFQVLFQCLSLKNVLFIINCMLLEQRILIHSNHHGLLTPVCEALCALMFPFVWEHVYVPFLPVKLIEYLQAPVPYIMGLHTSSLATKIGADIFSSCVVVHLDKDKVVTPISSRIDDSPVDFVLARLPTPEVDTLLRTVEHLVPQPVNGSAPPARGYTSTKNNSLLANRTLSHPSSPLQHVVESLNFCNSRPPTENELELTFGEGPLGITFESTHLRMLAVNHFQPGRQPGTSAVVKTLPRLHNGLPGPAERSGLIRAGSFLVAINGVSTLDLTFEETIDRLRVEKRPVRLRFLNASAPHESACRFAERLQSLSLVSALQIDHSNTLFRWVDAVRGAFAVLFTSIFRDFQRYVLIEHIGASPTSSSSPSGVSKRAPSLTRSPSAHAHTSIRRRRSSAFAFSVTFDHASFCEASAEATTAAVAANSPVGFLREFTQAQSFVGFVNDSVMGRISHTTSYPQVELFHNCIHLYHEIGDPVAAAEAIALLFERDHTAIETLELALPLRDDELVDVVAVGQTLLSDAQHAYLPDASRSPVRSPVKSPLAAGLPASSPCKRTSTTRQLEMIICGSLPDPLDADAISCSVEAALSVSLDTELLKQLDDDPATPETSGVSPSPSNSLPFSSSSSTRVLTVDRRSESLSSSESTSSPSVVDEKVINQALVQKTQGSSKSRQLSPEDTADDPLHT